MAQETESRCVRKRQNSNGKGRREAVRFAVHLFLGQSPFFGPEGEPDRRLRASRRDARSLVPVRHPERLERREVAPGKKRGLTAAGRKKLSDAMKARWAARRKAAGKK